MSETTQPLDPSAIRNELNNLKQHLNAHNKKEIDLGDQYQPYLKRTMTLIGMLNKTTAGPKASQTKRKLAVAAANPDSLDDL